MRRLDPPPTPREGLAQLLALQKDGLGLRLLLERLPKGATLEDARRLRARLHQLSRKKCSFLDRDLGIER